MGTRDKTPGCNKMGRSRYDLRSELFPPVCLLLDALAAEQLALGSLKLFVAEMPLVMQSSEPL